MPFAVCAKIAADAEKGGYAEIAVAYGKCCSL
jgi:hypothetical protein